MPKPVRDIAGERGARPRWRALAALASFGAALLPAPSVPAAEIEAGILDTPGYMWAEFRYPGARQPEEDDNAIGEGLVHQGIDLVAFGRLARLEGFAEVEFRGDTAGFDYNNELILAPGAQLKTPLFGVGQAALGARYEVSYRHETNRTLEGAVGFLKWSARKDWPAAPEAAPLRYIASTWGEVRYPSALSDLESDNLIVEGSVEVSADWTRLAGIATVNTFVSVDYKADTEELDFNNEVEPAIGARLRLPVGEVAHVEVGAKLVNEYRFVSDRSETGMIGFVGVAAAW